MFPLQTIVIDDEQDAGKLLKNLLNEFPAIDVKEVFNDSNMALDFIIARQPSVAFLDIEMPELNGMEMLKQMREFAPETKVIFVTAFKNYALEAIQNSAFDFICKPVDKTELRRVVSKLIAAFNNQNDADGITNPKQILLKTAEGYHHIITQNILYLEADINYTTIILKDGKKLLSSMNIGKIQDNILPDKFVRISRKHVINKDHLSFISFVKKYCVLTYGKSEYKLSISSKMKHLKLMLA